MLALILIAHNLWGQVYLPSLTNTISGYDAGASITSGTGNTLIGTASGNRLTIGNNNTFVGYLSGYYTANGSGNLFIGANTGIYNTSGSNNIFFGSFAGSNNMTGNNNLALGRYAYYSPKASDNNIVIGNLAGYGVYNSSYTSMVLIGNKAGYSLIAGSNSVIIGDSSGYSLSAAYNSILIGASPQDTIVSNTINIGDKLLIDTEEGSIKVFISTEPINSDKILVLDDNNEIKIGNMPQGIASKMYHETPTGVKDGSNVTFTLAHTPELNTEMIYLNGILIMPNTDYEMNGNMIIFSFPPTETDIIQVSYEYFI
jgi:hypothetical protein